MLEGTASRALGWDSCTLAPVHAGSRTLAARPAAGFSVSMRQQYVGRLSGGRLRRVTQDPVTLLEKKKKKKREKKKKKPRPAESCTDVRTQNESFVLSFLLCSNCCSKLRFSDVQPGE